MKILGSNSRRFAICVTSIAALVLVFAPGAGAAKADLIWYLGSPTRTVIDRKPAGSAIGFYTTSQITVRAGLPGGQENRDVSLTITAPGGVIYAKSLIVATPGVPPSEAQTFAITGGTGKYAGVSGESIHSGFTSAGSKIAFYFN
ncbi:MAG: hypothetical protein NTV96_03860 [Actinobacteria bacterium]|nr:hypothetical protein [Actinomycetota bacterium]